MRALRVIMGIYIIFNSLMEQQYLFALIGLFFAYQGVMNVGCGACAAIPADSNKSESENIVTYEELSSKTTNQ